MQPQNDDWQQPDQTHSAANHALAESTDAQNPTVQQSPEATGPVELREGDDTVVRWQASEYIQRDKNTSWFIGLAVVSVGLMLLAIFILKSITFAVLIPVMITALVVYIVNPPATLNYTLSRKGLHINDRLYHFADFREFGLVRDDLANSVMLIPRKRLSPSVTVYFPTEVGEPIVDMLAARLPMREVKLDPIDRLLRFLRI